MESEASARRDLLYYLLGPAALLVVVTWIFQVVPWTVPIPQQGWYWYPTLYLAAQGAVGVSLSSFAGLPSVPRLGQWHAWRPLLLWSGLTGLAWGAVLLLLEENLHYLQQSVNGTWMNVALPASIAHYAAGAVIAEIPLRTFLFPCGIWLIGVLLLRGRTAVAVFWFMAILTSAIEPITTVANVMHINLAAAVFVVQNFLLNLEEAFLFRRFGWPAPFVFRIGLYAVFHVFGAYLVDPGSFQFPGPH